MIKQIYLDSLPKSDFYSYTIDDIDITYYFGNYDGAYVVNFNNLRGWCGMTYVHEHEVCVVKEEYVSYVCYTFQCFWPTIMVVKDGVCYNIEHIMLLHIIRYEDMLNIYGLYKDMILNKDEK